MNSSGPSVEQFSDFFPLNKVAQDSLPFHKLLEMRPQAANQEILQSH